MTDGIITGMTNPSTGNIVVTSLNHGLKNGFTVLIKGAEGYKTNEQKEQVDENGDLVSQGAVPLVIQSAANGLFEIEVLNSDQFEILSKSGNCDFLNNGSNMVNWFKRNWLYLQCLRFVCWRWSEWSPGIATVDPSSQEVVSILITEPGADM